MSNLKLAGKSALVTGASEGIGRSIALDLAAQGAFVILNSRSASKLQPVVDEIKQKGGNAIAIPADVSKLSDIKTLFEKVADVKPTVDIIIHNAAIAEFKPIAEVTEDDWDRHFNLNAKGSFFVLQAAAKIVANGGRIIAISSTGTKAAVPGGSVYFGTKGALEQVLLSFLERSHPSDCENSCFRSCSKEGLCEYRESWVHRNSYAP